MRILVNLFLQESFGSGKSISESSEVRGWLEKMEQENQPSLRLLLSYIKDLEGHI